MSYRVRLILEDDDSLVTEWVLLDTDDPQEATDRAETVALHHAEAFGYTLERKAPFE